MTTISGFGDQFPDDIDQVMTGVTSQELESDFEL